jgi:outer membrane protein TolC
MILCALTVGALGLSPVMSAAAQKPKAAAAAAPVAPKLGRGVTFTDAEIAAMLSSARGSSRLKATMKARLEATRSVLDRHVQEFAAGRGGIEELIDASHRLLRAETDICNRTKEQIAAWQGHVDFLKQIEKQLQEGAQAGVVPAHDVKDVECRRLEAEVTLERLKSDM